MSGRRYNLNGGKVMASQQPHARWVPALVPGAETMEHMGIVWSFEVKKPKHSIGPGKKTWYTYHKPGSKYNPREEDRKHAS